MVTLLVSAACAWQSPHAPLAVARVPRSPSVVMARWTAADMRSKRLELPQEVDAMLSADTDRKNTKALWAALRSCFKTEKEAIAAASRNTGTILPYLNSPSNIYGSFDVLVEMLGKEGAVDVCSKNPGILQCNPKILARESADSIVNAANQVDFFERELLGSMPPALRQNLDKVAFLLLAIPVAKRLADCAGATCG